MAGSSMVRIEESLMTQTSAASSSRCDSMKGRRLGEETSSSPSIRNLTLTGGHAARFQVRLDRFDMDEKLALVVGRATRPDLAVFHDGFERLRVPAVFLRGRNDVVVPVDQHGWLIRTGVQPVAVNNRVAGGGHDGNVLDAGCAHVPGQPLRRGGHIGGPVRAAGQARDAQECLQLVEKRFTLLARIGASVRDRISHDVTPSAETCSERRGGNGDSFRCRSSRCDE